MCYIPSSCSTIQLPCFFPGYSRERKELPISVLNAKQGPWVWPLMRQNRGKEHRARASTPGPSRVPGVAVLPTWGALPALSHKQRVTLGGYCVFLISCSYGHLSKSGLLKRVVQQVQSKVGALQSEKHALPFTSSANRFLSLSECTICI